MLPDVALNRYEGGMRYEMREREREKKRQRASVRISRLCEVRVMREVEVETGQSYDTKSFRDF